MTPARLQRIEEIFHSALDQHADQVGAFLQGACGDDELLRLEVEGLLASHHHATGFIENPVIGLGARILENAQLDLLLGRKIGRYQIVRRIGAGGMGDVYLATDTVAGRKAAVKLLPLRFTGHPERRQRFEQEARAVVALNHPNIVTAYEIGEESGTPYIASELINGETLRQALGRGPLAVDRAIDITIQVAAALAAAHETGIVHRDIKPENIMLRPDGYVKVLDFGVAKLAEQLPCSSSDQEERESHLETRAGAIVGTACYMSPEQALGQPIGPSSDIWSLGVVLYEMVTGHVPFSGQSPQEITAAILATEPVPLPHYNRAVPLHLQEVIQRALCKTNQERYQSASELAEALKRLRLQMEMRAEALPSDATPFWSRRKRLLIGLASLVLIAMAALFAFNRKTPFAALEKSIAVLPFENLSSKKTDKFLVDGIQDDILTGIGKIKDLKVISHESAMEYRDAARNGKLREVGRSLGVSYLLIGKVRHDDERVVLNVSLVDARDEHQVWSERYDRTLKDTLSLQGELALDVARALQARIRPAENAFATEKPTENPDAYLLYLRGREVDLRSDNSQQAVALYQQAIDLDPGFALARARLSILISMNSGWPEYAQLKSKARSEAEEALRLRPQLGEAHLALTFCYLYGEQDEDRALAELTRTAELLPNSAEVPLTAAFIYKRQNKFRERLAALHRAETLDPHNRTVLFILTLTNAWIRDWTEALRAIDRHAVVAATGRTDPHRWWRANLEFERDGDINTLKKELAEQANNRPNADWLVLARFETAMFERDYAKASQLLAGVTPGVIGDPSFVFGLEKPHWMALNQAMLAMASEQDPTSRQTALAHAEQAIQTNLSTTRGAHEARARADLAIIHAFLGDGEEAVRQARLAEDVMPGPIGCIEKNAMSSALAVVYAWTGEHEKALDLIERLLITPMELNPSEVYNVSLTNLKWRWIWDPLRNNSRFQKLLAGPEPRTVY